jgi:hypothetical protein
MVPRNAGGARWTELGEAHPGKSSSAVQQRYAIGDRSDRCILTTPGQQTLNLRIVPGRLHRDRPRKAHRPNCCGLCLLLDAVVIDHDHVGLGLVSTAYSGTLEPFVP